MNRLRHILLISALLCLSSLSFGQSKIVKDFRPACDSLTRMVKERTGISSPQLRLNAVMKRGKTLDFYFTESLSDCPWYAGDPQWFRKELKALFPEAYSSYNLGQIYSKKQSPDKFVVPHLDTSFASISTVQRSIASIITASTSELMIGLSPTP